MKNAKLWKRVLYEGIGGEDSDGLPHCIATATIICDNTPRSSHEVFSASDILGKQIALPLWRFWVEFPKEGDVQVGAYVASPLVANRSVDLMIWPIMAVDGLSVRKCPPMGIWFEEDECTVREFKDMTELRVENGLTHSAVISSFVCSSLMLLSCKNVDLEARDPDPKAAKVARKRHGHTEHDYRYHVLVVRPAGARSDAPAQEIGTMPRHVCRGHFAEYGPKYGKGLLFGKYEGRFYVPPHVKGDAKNGRVYKDYEVPA